MYTIDAVEEILNQIADEIPDELFNNLNGGIILLEECKAHPNGANDLYIMGQYHNRRDMGRYISIYYGSFMRLYANVPEEVLREKLRDTLLHEFTHHIESLAGERGLEIKDQIFMNEYHRIRRKKEV